MSFDEQISQVLSQTLAGFRTRMEVELGAVARRFADAEASASVRLLDAVRRLDDARSLSQLLDLLAECAAREAGRGAVFVVKDSAKGSTLTGWRMAGFGDDQFSSRSTPVDLDAAGLVGVAARTMQKAESADGDRAAMPAFARSANSDPRHAIALPLIVGGQVVAVLYADAPRPEGPLPGRWPATLEVLARYAGRVMETITVQQAAGFARPRSQEHR